MKYLDLVPAGKSVMVKIDAQGYECDVSISNTKWIFKIDLAHSHRIQIEWTSLSKIMLYKSQP